MSSSTEVFSILVLNLMTLINFTALMSLMTLVTFMVVLILTSFMTFITLMGSDYKGIATVIHLMTSRALETLLSSLAFLTVFEIVPLMTLMTITSMICMLTLIMPNVSLRLKKMVDFYF